MSLCFPFFVFSASDSRFPIIFEIVAFVFLYVAVFVNADFFSVAERESHKYASVKFYLLYYITYERKKSTVFLKKLEIKTGNYKYTVGDNCG